MYNHPHIGNARPAVVFDVLFRLLKHRFGDVLYVRNITDIEDKIMAAAEAEGVATEVITRRYAALPFGLPPVRCVAGSGCAGGTGMVSTLAAGYGSRGRSPVPPPCLDR